MQARTLVFALILGVCLGVVGCQTPPSPTAPAPTSPSPTTAPPVKAPPATPPPTAAPSPAVEAPPTTASRVDVLSAADAAVRAGDLRSAADLYGRALNTPPSAGESAAIQSAVRGLAGLRRVILLAELGEEDAARRELEALQAAGPDNPFSRVAAEFWHAYGQTGSVRSACAQAAPNLATVLTPALAPLANTPAGLDPARLCPA